MRACIHVYGQVMSIDIFTELPECDIHLIKLYICDVVSVDNMTFGSVCEVVNPRACHLNSMSLFHTNLCVMSRCPYKHYTYRLIDIEN